MNALDNVVHLQARANVPRGGILPEGHTATVLAFQLPRDARRAYELYVQAAAIDEDHKTYDEAERLYRLALRYDPKLAIAWTNLGNIRFRLGDCAAADECYTRALEIDPRQPEAHYNLGYMLREDGCAGSRDSAIEHFRKALDADAKFADAHFNLALTLADAGKDAEARKHYEKYIELEPNSYHARYALDRIAAMKKSCSARKAF